MQRPRLKARHFLPLAGFVVPTVLVGYGVVIPRGSSAGWNELSLGFGARPATPGATTLRSPADQRAAAPEREATSPRVEPVTAQFHPRRRARRR